MGWWRSALISVGGVAPSWMVSLSASVNLPLHHKVRKFSYGTGSPGWFRKKGRKTVVVVVGRKTLTRRQNIPTSSDRATSERDVTAGQKYVSDSTVDTAHQHSPIETPRAADECCKMDCGKSALHMDVEQDFDQLLLHDPPVMFAFLADAFRELDEIMNRVCRVFSPDVQFLIFIFQDLIAGRQPLQAYTRNVGHCST